MTNKKNSLTLFQEQMKEAILKSLSEDVIPWQKPWEVTGGSLPYNATTNQPYTNTNSFNLMMQSVAKGYNDPRWCTYKQAEKMGWQVRRGEKSSRIIFTSVVNRETNQPVTAQDFEGMTLEERKVLRDKLKTIYKPIYVFNASQIDRIPPLENNENPIPIFDNEKIEKYLKDLQTGMGVSLNFGGDRAYYSPSKDQIILPNKDDFKSYQGYVETYLHEFTHASGHPDRLNRNLSGSFGSKAYAKEELIAELNSMFLSIDLGIVENERNIENTKAYCQNWHQIIKENDSLLNEAIMESTKARAYMHEIGDWKFELTPKQEKLEVNRDTLSASVLITDYAQNVLGLNIEPHGKDNVRLVEHSTCVIYPDNSFYRYSREVGGSIFDFVMMFEDLDFKEAYERVEAYYKDFSPELRTTAQSIYKTKQKDLELPLHAKNNDRVINYLVNERGINLDLVSRLIDEKMIYEDTKGNAVFVGYEKHKATFASRRSTYSNFKGDVSGSIKSTGWLIDNDAPHTLFVTESAIDAMSLMELNADEREGNYLSVNGVSSIETWKNYIENNPDAQYLNKIVIAFDNDEAGITASNNMADYIRAYWGAIDIEIMTPKEKDFNIDLLIEKGMIEEISFESFVPKQEDDFFSKPYETITLSQNMIHKTIIDEKENMANTVFTFQSGSKYEGYHFHLPASQITPHPFDVNRLSVNILDGEEHRIYKVESIDNRVSIVDEKYISSSELKKGLSLLSYEKESDQFVRVNEAQLEYFKEAIDQNLSKKEMIDTTNTILNEEKLLSISKRDIFKLQKMILEENNKEIEVFIETLKNEKHDRIRHHKTEKTKISSVKPLKDKVNQMDHEIEM